MLGRICIIENCQNEQLSNSRYCASCYKEHKRENTRKHYARKGKGVGTCSVCGKVYIKRNQNQKFCTECYDKIKHATASTKCTAPYHRTTDHCSEHRTLAKKLNLITSEKDDVVHHINLNTRDNVKSNLLIMTNSNHVSFHHYLNAEIVQHPDKTIEELTWKILEEKHIPYKRFVWTIKNKPA